MPDTRVHGPSCRLPRTACRAALVVLATLATATAAQAQTTLFDPALGLPSAQGWLPLLQGTPGSVGSSASSTTLDTSADASTLQGWGRFSPVALDTASGFTLGFTLQINAASSSSINRGGFSVLFTGQDASRSLELAFGTGEVFAYDHQPLDPDRLVRGSAASFSSGVAHDYLLEVVNQQYTLRIDGSPALGGSLHDYRAEGLPYSLASFVFLGDDTSRASSSVAIGPVMLLSAVPEPASAALWLAGIALLGMASRRRRQRPHALS